MEGKLTEIIRLENGLILKMFDRSRQVAGERWLVSFEAQVDVEVKPEYFAGECTSAVPFEDIRALLGEKATYRHRKDRNFIDEKEKDIVFNGLRKRFLEAGLRYLSCPEFPCRLILRRYQETYPQVLLRKRQQSP